MTTRVFVKPLDGKIIPLPDGNGDLPVQGKHVTLSSFWYRRRSDGDVVFTDQMEEGVGEAVADIDAVVLEGEITVSSAPDAQRRKK